MIKLHTYYNITIYLIITLLFSITGCENSGSTTSLSPHGENSLGSSAGMADYLSSVPAVRTVEAWENPYGQGITIQTEHYEIKTTMLEPLMLKQIPAFMESAYKAYQKQLPQEITTHGKFTLYLFASRGQWEDFTDDFTGDFSKVYKQIRKGAYYSNGACVAYYIGRKATFGVLGHEGWHQFNSRHFRYRLPSWLDEGIAMLYEASRFERDGFVFEPSKNYNRLGGLKLTLMKNKMIRLENLIELNPGEVLSWDSGDEGLMAFYSQSYALVRFLREDFYGKRLGAYQQMLLGAVNGTWPIDGNEAQMASDRNIPLTAQWNRHIARKIFDVYIRQDMEKLEGEYISFCRKITYNISVKE